MPPPLVPNIYQVTTFGTLYGKPCDHVINWLVAGGGHSPTENCVDLIQADHDEWINMFQHVAGPGYVYKGSTCKYLGDLVTPAAVGTESFAGLSTGVRVPAFCAVTFRHKYPGRGRGKDGRTNFPNIVIDLVDPADAYSLTGAAETELQAAWVAFFGGMVHDILTASGAALSLVILDRKLGTYAVPSGTSVDPYLNTHRRWAKRLPRH
jgi:hypothetical protein